jgi:hypothetical protein
MSRKKHAFLAKDLTPEERKKAFIKEYPEYKDHPFWDEDGMPTPDPAFLATFVPGDFDFDDDDEELL